MAVVVAHHYSSRRVGRSVWCRVRSRHLWEAVQNGLVGDRWWKENLHMSEGTFCLLCNLLHPYIEKKVYCKVVFVCNYLSTVFNIHRLLPSECLCLLKKELL